MCWEEVTLGGGVLDGFPSLRGTRVPREEQIPAQAVAGDQTSSEALGL